MRERAVRRMAGLLRARLPELGLLSGDYPDGILTRWNDAA